MIGVAARNLTTRLAHCFNNFNNCNHFLPVALQPNSGLGRLLMKFLDHIQTNKQTHKHTLQDSSELVISSIQRLLLTQYSKNTRDEYHAISEIQIRSPIH
jgi:hypothetical protein